MARKGEPKVSLRPLRASLASLGAGMAWAAMHMPVDVTQVPQTLAWILQAIAVALLVRAGLELMGAVLVSSAKSIAALFGRRP